MDTESGRLSRRTFLRATGAAGGSLAVGSVTGRAAATGCGDTYESSTNTGEIDYTGDGDEYSFTTVLADPCEVVYTLRSDDYADFDLYCTLDGRTPTPSDYDRVSQGNGTDEQVVLDGTEVTDGQDYGVLVYSHQGGGEYTLEAEEYGLGDGGGGGDANDPPEADFYIHDNDGSVTVGREVDFNADDSYDPDGSIESYAWDFGDGTQAGGESPSHTYDDTGTYRATLTVTDDDGATDSAYLDIEVTNAKPTAVIEMSDESPLPGDTVEFDGQDSSDPGGSIVAYDWEFGDGTRATGRTAAHTYDEPGYYTVRLTVRDDDGATDTARSEVGVVNDNLQADFTVSSDSVAIGETVSVDGSPSSDPDDDIVGYEWEFGDGTTATGQTASHSYTTGGSKTITLTVTGEHGYTRQATRTVQVTNEPPTARAAASSTTPEIDTPVTFDGTDSTDPDGASDIDSYLWTFPGGFFGPDKKRGKTVTHEFDSAGSVDVTLEVTDRSGAVDTTTITLEVQEGDGGSFW